MPQVEKSHRLLLAYHLRKVSSICAKIKLKIFNDSFHNFILKDILKLTHDKGVPVKDDTTPYYLRSDEISRIPNDLSYITDVTSSLGPQNCKQHLSELLKVTSKEEMLKLLSTLPDNNFKISVLISKLICKVKLYRQLETTSEFFERIRSIVNISDFIWLIGPAK